MRKITIAVDGYSSCGKSTVAKGIAKKLGYLFIDSGAMYRAVTLYCIHNNIIRNGKFNDTDVVIAMDNIHMEFKLNEQTHQSEIHLNGKNVEKEIREMNVSNFVSPISAIKEVRDRIVILQRKFRNANGIVMDGRDIGTNVFPDAELKIFMTADENVRTQRRWKELDAKGQKVTMEEIKNNLGQRDYEDTHRKYNPLRKAEDAVVLDNTHMTLEEQLNFALKLVQEKAES
ncbi:MAG: (d)CMP kinase [Bacteroidetes bacterium]|nr:MAG: (d)CMP kinase [Bacteroidota bacterium]